MNKQQYIILKAINNLTTESLSFVPHSLLRESLRHCPDVTEILNTLPPSYFDWKKEKVGTRTETSFWVSPEGQSALADYEKEKNRDIWSRFAVIISVISLIVSFLAFFCG